MCSISYMLSQVLATFNFLNAECLFRFDFLRPGWRFLLGLILSSRRTWMSSGFTGAWHFICRGVELGDGNT